MNIKVNKSVKALMMLTIIVLGCIREDVELPPVLQPLSTSILLSNSIVTLNGANFNRSANVYVNDSLVSIEGEPTATEIKFIVPFVRQKRETFIYVTTDIGSSVSQPITILPPVPYIKNIIPTRASVNTTIKIVGSYFTESLVQFKSASDADWIDVLPTQLGDTLFVVVPADLQRDAADIRLKSLSGESNPSAFHVLVPPTISAVIPAKAGAGAEVTVVGEDFDFVLDLFFGDIPAEIISATTDKLLARVPEGVSSDILYVQTEGGKKAYAQPFIFIPSPNIEDIDRKSGSIGMPLTITGTYFDDALEVRFGSVKALIESNTSTVIKTKVPDFAQSGDISVTTPGGKAIWNEQFVVEGAPLISAFDPTSGNAQTEITVKGLNLSKVTKATLGLVEMDIVANAQTDNELKVKVRDGSVTGKISVSGIGGTYETQQNFTVLGSLEILTVEPESGSAGSIITISGKNFPANPEIIFSDDISVKATSASSDQIVCQVPPNAKTGRIRVLNALSPKEFIVPTTPEILTITPLKGSINREITITGKNLKGADVYFQNNRLAEKVIDDITKLVVKVPSSATSGKIIVSKSGVSVASTDIFEVIAPATISSFFPTSGGTGTTITINGTNLQHTPIVHFFNQIPAAVKSISPTQILVDVPLGASTGRLSVTTDASNSPSLSQASFIVIGKPIIASISPPAGTVKEKVIINGDNFANLVSVMFDGVATKKFLDSSKTQIICRVPENVVRTTNRSINVQVVTKSDVSRNYTFSLLGYPTITRISPKKNPHDWNFLIEGTNLGSIKKITLGGKVPDVKSNGIDKQAYNFITTKVPKGISATKQLLMLHYTIEDSAISREYEVMAAPPPGVFPPAQILIPPPLPTNYVQTDLANYWIDENYKVNDPNTRSCYQLRVTFIGESEGRFCEVNKFYSNKDRTSGVWSYDQFIYGLGTYNRGDVELLFRTSPTDSIYYTGRVLDQKASKLVLEDQNGWQTILVMEEPNGPCFQAYRASGPCD